MTAGKVRISSGPTEGRIGRPRRAVTKRLNGTLLDLVAEAFRDSDFAEISLERLAARIGISKPTLYRRFPNRGALLEAMVELQLAMLLDHDAGGSARAEGAVDDLRTYAQRLFLSFLRPTSANLIQFVIQESGTNPRLAELRHGWHLKVLAELHRLLEQAQLEGSFAEQDRARLANLLIDLLYTPINLRLMRFDENYLLSDMSPEDFFAWRFDLFLATARGPTP